MAHLGELMEAEMREQPALLAAKSGAYCSQLRGFLDGKDFEMVLLAARGSSDHAALYARYLIEVTLGIPVSLAAPSVLTQFRAKMRYPKTLCIGISQSGAAPDVTEVIAELRRQGHTTLAVTNTAESRITRAAEFTLLLDAGLESSIAATKTYSLSVLAMYQVVRALGGSLPEPNLPGEDWLESCRASAEAQIGPLLRCTPLFSLGRGWSFCTAQETALKLMECALLPCKAYSTADFAHGPRALADRRTAAIVYGAVPEGLEATGCEIIRAPESHSDRLSPVWDIFFGQWLALLSARARGLDPDRAVNLSKVTQTL